MCQQAGLPCDAKLCNCKDCHNRGEVLEFVSQDSASEVVQQSFSVAGPQAIISMSQPDILH